MADEQIKRLEIKDFIASGPAAIIKLEDIDFEGIDFKDCRMFFKPNKIEFWALRVSPSITSRYGPKMKVFAIPPAISQWATTATKLNITNLKVEIFVEDLSKKSFRYYDCVTYVFGTISTQTLLSESDRTGK